MRIISGKFKGRRLIAKLPNGIRPTQDSMRETIFNILNNYIELADCVVADVCAGTGMLGIESLSRGAKFVYFVDKNYKAVEYIKNSLQMLDISLSDFSLNNLDVLQFIQHICYLCSKDNEENDKLDLLFLDPPYNTNIINEALMQISDCDILSKNGIIVAETAIRNNILLHEDYCILTERQFGVSKVYFIVRGKDKF